MIQELSILLESYEDRGIKSREYYFLRDMEYNLKKERNISEGQRSWLERILERGAPKAVDKDSLAKIESLIELDSISSAKKKVLSNLRSQAYSGKILSEKQKKLIEQISSQAASPKRFLKDSKTIEQIRFILKLTTSRKPSYWRLRPQQLQAISELNEWLEWSDSGSMCQEPPLDVYSYESLKKIFKRQLSELEKSPHPEGSMRLIKISSEYIPALVIGKPYVSDLGYVVHPVLVNGINREVKKLFMPSDVKTS